MKVEREVRERRERGERKRDKDRVTIILSGSTLIVTLFV